MEIVCNRNHIQSREKRRGQEKGKTFAYQEAIVRPPRLRLVAQDSEFPGQLAAAAFDVAINPFTVGGEARQMIFRQKLEDASAARRSPIKRMK